MALNLYLDDCSNSDLLADLLRQAGHRVTRPTDDGVGLDGEDDPVHFGFAAAHGLTIITYTVEPHSASEQALNFLASWSAQPSPANPRESETIEETK